MGLFKKIKDIFYDDVEEEEEEKKTEYVRPTVQEVRPVERNSEPVEEKKEERLSNTFSERELFKPEKTFNFPIFNEEEKREEPHYRTRTEPIQTQNYERPYKREVREERPKEIKKEVKTFQPTPVISPIYGILDKNYKKEEITQKRETIKVNPKNKDYDYVRRKAYGTLEDELENTIADMSSMEESHIKVEEEKSKNIEDLLSQIENKANISVGELEDAINKEDRHVIESEKIEKDPDLKRNMDETLEHDLFNLIDSMYDKED